MIQDIIHVGVVVSDIDKAIDFYQNTLGLKYQGKLKMEGERTDKLFGFKGASCIVAYLNGGDHIKCPPVELIMFENKSVKKQKEDFKSTGIAEICFKVDDIMEEYNRLKALGVEFISSPQKFEFKDYGFSNSMAVYFKDTDGTILELIQAI